jgi:hypothetical protein
MTWLAVTPLPCTSAHDPRQQSTDNGGLLTAAEMVSKQTGKQQFSSDSDRTCRKVRRLLRSDACSRSALSRVQQTTDKIAAHTWAAKIESK